MNVTIWYGYHWLAFDHYPVIRQGHFLFDSTILQDIPSFSGD